MIFLEFELDNILLLLSVCCKVQVALFIAESEFICFLELFILDGIREVIRKSMFVNLKNAHFHSHNLFFL